METKNKLTDSNTKLYEIVLNRYLPKKYDWFEKIEIDDIGYDKNFMNSSGSMSIDGTIYVDEDWLHSQWREYHYSTPFPDIEDEELGISLGDFIGGDLSEELKYVFLSLFAGVTNLPRPQYISWSWIKVRTKIDEEDIIDENIKIVNEIIDRLIESDPSASMTRIINENSKKDRIQTLIDKLGFENACKSVGGIQQIGKLMNVRPIELLKKYFIGSKLSTEDLEKGDGVVGGYDIECQPTEISENFIEGIYIDYTITKGTVNLIGTGETFDLFDSGLRKKQYWWEIEYELQDIFRDYSYYILSHLNYDIGDNIIYVAVLFDNKI